jgi:hypothetical protein
MRSLFLDDCCFDSQIVHSGNLHLGNPQDLEDFDRQNVMGERPRY